MRIARFRADDRRFHVDRVDGRRRDHGDSRRHRYSDVWRLRDARIIDGTSKMGDIRTQMEKWFMDNRTYLNAAAWRAASIDAYNKGSFGRFYDHLPGRDCNDIHDPGRRQRREGNERLQLYRRPSQPKTSNGPGGKYTNGGCWALKKDGPADEIAPRASR
jgi:hypothetical protein